MVRAAAVVCAAAVVRAAAHRLNRSARAAIEREARILTVRAASRPVSSAAAVPTVCTAGFTAVSGRAIALIRLRIDRISARTDICRAAAGAYILIAARAGRAAVLTGLSAAALILPAAGGTSVSAAAIPCRPARALGRLAAAPVIASSVISIAGRTCQMKNSFRRGLHCILCSSRPFGERSFIHFIRTVRSEYWAGASCAR